MKATKILLNAALRSPELRSKSISFIGLGRMGSEMAYNLFSKRFAEATDSHFVVCDAVEEATKSFQDNFLGQFPGAKLDVVKTPQEAVLSSETIITMLPSTPQVNTVYRQLTGIIPTLRSFPSAGFTLLIDSTTLDVQVARSIAAEVIDTGADMVDAPVSGGVLGAKAGTLSFLVGGMSTAFERARPLLELMGKRIFHCGGSGAGLGAKICNNLVLGVEQIVVAEAMLLGQKLGLDPAVLASVINSSTGACWSSSINNPVPGALPDKSPPCERDFEGGFATALMLKDMGLATNIARNTGAPLPLGEAAEKLYAHVLVEDPQLIRKDFSSVYRYLSQCAQEGKRVRIEEIASAEEKS
ncbi:3-hydroxyisobutyrate dehydrogenase [Gloeophyllum trabeum ATCC 11539]|uniref:3-hydroxyisobutyrate dehydrogenase n=1 Tax=Gloeophyllum trabeum (strain ATCC 11539 / FP-39264 / Madison 617) TaxID=670483 RepID=S7RXH7_GLOTA|nr:3-hydroxyisobutyrate dehydrogenase [Gloeophyllum trabeum ATCC 11539]EPQ58054.1 3-hydroxyisobutyrate dehydrogenase [Gloeophyllum trabeum ATCC 11539]